MFWGNKAAIFLSPFSDRCHAPRSVTLVLSSPLLSLILHKVEAKPQEVHEGLKVAPMITAAASFVDPRLQTADQIVRIYRSLEVSPTRTADQPNLPTTLPFLETSRPEILQARPGSRCRWNVAAAPPTRGPLAACQSNHGSPFLGSADNNSGCGDGGEHLKTPSRVWNLRSKRHQEPYHRLSRRNVLEDQIGQTTGSRFAACARVVERIKRRGEQPYRVLRFSVGNLSRRK
jgi:hypothetical protein